MNALLTRSALRFYLHHPAQLALAIIGIALGVAVVVAVDLASLSSLRAFELSRSLIAGRSTHSIEAVIGLLPETLYPEVKIGLGIAHAAPLLEGEIDIREPAPVTVRLLGLDPLAELAYDDDIPGLAAGGAVPIAALMSQPGTVLLPSALAERLGVGPGDELSIARDGELQQLSIVGVRAFAGGNTDGPVIADIASAQELLDAVGKLSRIELVLSDDEADRLATVLPPGATLAAIDSVETPTGAMLKAFRINLSALSLLALVVGMLLIYATMSFAIVQRRQSMGTLRALGVTRQEIVRQVLAESLALGIVATSVGLAGGWLLSRSLIEIVLVTMNDLYFTSRVTPDALPILPFIKAAGLGVGATIGAAIGPALSAAREMPRATLSRIAFEQGIRRKVKRAPLLAIPCFAAAALLIGGSEDGLLAAFAGLFLILCGYGLLVPPVTALLLRILQPPAARLFGVAASLAVRGAAASLGRTGIAVTALAVAVATLIGIGVMIDSFRGSVEQWLERSLLADYYLVATRSARSEQDYGFSRSEIGRIGNIDGVRAVSETRIISIATQAGDVALRAAKPGPLGYGEEIIGIEAASAYAELQRGDAVLVPEPYAVRHGIVAGDSLRLPTPGGVREFRVAGVFRDYRTSNSGLLIPYTVFTAHWGYLAPTGLGIYLAGGADEAKVYAALTDFSASHAATRVVANAEIRRITLDIFDRTFEITGVLRVLAGIIAFFGILSALLALQLERSREVATLRAIGFTREQVSTNSMVQTTLLGFIAGLVALPLGLLLALLLVFVINQRSFGWSMGFVAGADQLAAGIVLALSAAFLAGLYPAFRLSRQAIAGHLRAE